MTSKEELEVDYLFGYCQTVKENLPSREEIKKMDEEEQDDLRRECGREYGKLYG